jgi:beta-lactamase regulating signal transducer with metallopeptidase domain
VDSEGSAGQWLDASLTPKAALSLIAIAGILLTALVVGAIVCVAVLILSRSTRSADVLNEPFDLEDENESSFID